MTRTEFARLLATAVAAVSLLVFAVSASAQTGTLRGIVTDAEGKPIEGATISITSTGTGSTRQVKTNEKGEWIQIGVFPGEYTITAEKDDLKFVAENFRVGIGDHPPIEMTLQKAGPSKEQQEQNAALQKLFDDGVAASRAGDYDTSIAKFTEALKSAPQCQDCYYNIGFAHAQKKEWEKAEAAYKKAVEIKPDYAAAWNGLANAYNAQNKLDLALEASNKAAESGGGATGGGGSATGLYNQGVILWNQSKFPEARDKFEAATKADPKYAEAWYMLGSANTNVGNFAQAVAAYEEYLKIDPGGSHAADAKERIEQLKPLVNP